jgi:hypothetical protein
MQWFDILVTLVIDGKSLIKRKAGEQLGLRENIHLREKIIAFYELVFEDGDCFFYDENTAYQNVYIAESHARLGEYDRALDRIERAADCGVRFMQLPNSAPFTSPLQDALTFKPEWAQSSPQSCAERILERLQSKHLDPIRSEERFTACVRRLEAFGVDKGQIGEKAL